MAKTDAPTTQTPGTDPAAAGPGPLAGLTVGRMVHYLRPDGQCRPAVVVRVWEPGREDGDGVVQLVIFCDGSNDNPYDGALVVWGSSVPFSAGPHDTGPRQTWHWPDVGAADSRAPQGRV